jgi:hypothetical protein
MSFVSLIYVLCYLKVCVFLLFEKNEMDNKKSQENKIIL